MGEAHVAGEKMFVDCAGTTVDVIDGLTGEVHAATAWKPISDTLGNMNVIRFPGPQQPPSTVETSEPRDTLGTALEVHRMVINCMRMEESRDSPGAIGSVLTFALVHNFGLDLVEWAELQFQEVYGYGSATETMLSGFADDMAAVLKAYLAMAGAFAKRKVGGSLWSEFVADVDARKAFTSRAVDVWN